MADPNTRQGKRTPVTLKIKFKSETLEQFIERYAVDVSQGGIFIRTKEPLAVGTQMKFEFQLRDASPLIAGEGTVVWTRENDPSRPAIAPGMGVRFDRLGEGSQTVLEKILAEKAKQAPQRGGNDGTTKPPLFTDTPTRVAPAPVQDALLGNRSGRTRQDSQETPLPKPMPFHSDADEFGAEAFEEATKVRALDELVAQTAAEDGVGGSDQASVDELAARRLRAETPLAEPPIDDRLKTVPDRDSAPGLPSPPESGNLSGRTGKLLDTTPSPRSAAPSSGPPLRPSQPNLPAASDLSAKTRLGLEPAKAQTTPPYQQQQQQQHDRQSVPRAVAAEQSHPSAPKRPSAAPVVIGILFVVAAAMAAVWYFVLRDRVEEDAGTKPVGSNGSALATGSGSATPNNGSGGSAVAMNGSGSAGSAAISVPKGPVVDTVIASNIAKSTVTVVDGDEQNGPAPFTAKLEKDKVYKVRVEAPGYVKVELDVKGGQDKVTAKLAPKPHVLSVSSDPPGALIYVDGASTGKVTPFDVELTAAQSAKPKLRVTLRKSGFRAVDQMFDAGSFKDDEAKMTGGITAKLAVQVIYTPPNNGNNNHPPNGSGAGSGSATPANTGSGETGSGGTPADHGTGSATPPPGTGSASTGGGGGGGTTPSPGASATGGAKTGSGGDPEPDFAKSH